MSGNKSRCQLWKLCVTLLDKLAPSSDSKGFCPHTRSFFSSQRKCDISDCGSSETLRELDAISIQLNTVMTPPLIRRWRRKGKSEWRGEREERKEGEKTRRREAIRKITLLHLIYLETMLTYVLLLMMAAVLRKSSFALLWSPLDWYTLKCREWGYRQGKHKHELSLLEVNQVMIDILKTGPTPSAHYSY